MTTSPFRAAYVLPTRGRWRRTTSGCVDCKVDAPAVQGDIDLDSIGDDKWRIAKFRSRRSIAQPPDALFDVWDIAMLHRHPALLINVWAFFIDPDIREKVAFEFAVTPGTSAAPATIAVESMDLPPDPELGEQLTAAQALAHPKHDNFLRVVRAEVGRDPEVVAFVAKHTPQANET